jgi:cbb3-type cytochrome oxidase subunit 3
MKLSDVMSAANLAVYAEIGLLIFLVVFLLVCVRVLWPGQKGLFDELGSLPLVDEVQPRVRAEVDHGL